jgi:hypothetical protein
MACSEEIYQNIYLYVTIIYQETYSLFTKKIYTIFLIPTFVA